MFRPLGFFLTAVMSVAAFGQAADTPFQIGFAANLNVGDSVINISNSGASSTVAAPVQNGNLCANVYTFSPDEQLVSCCSCNVTPNALVSLSARNDLISNTLTPAVPTSVVVKLMFSTGVTTCNAATVGQGANVLATGGLAWFTTIHAAPTSPVSYVPSRTAFTGATL